MLLGNAEHTKTFSKRRKQENAEAAQETNKDRPKKGTSRETTTYPLGCSGDTMLCHSLYHWKFGVGVACYGRYWKLDDAFVFLKKYIFNNTFAIVTSLK